MKTHDNNHSFRSVSFFEYRWGHPLPGFARFLGGTGFWISHAVIVSSVAGVLLLRWIETTLNQTIVTLATMMFGVALLFAFAGWIARRSR